MKYFKILFSIRKITIYLLRSNDRLKSCLTADFNSHSCDFKNSEAENTLEKRMHVSYEIFFVVLIFADSSQYNSQEYIVHWTNQLRIGLNDNNFQMLYLNTIKNGNTRDKKISHLENS